MARLLLGSGADADAANKAGLKPAGCVPAADEGGDDNRNGDEGGGASEGHAAARDELVVLLLEAEGEEAWWQPHTWRGARACERRAGR